VGAGEDGGGGSAQKMNGQNYEDISNLASIHVEMGKKPEFEELKQFREDIIGDVNASFSCIPVKTGVIVVSDDKGLKEISYKIVRHSFNGDMGVPELRDISFEPPSMKVKLHSRLGGVNVEVPGTFDYSGVKDVRVKVMKSNVALQPIEIASKRMIMQRGTVELVIEGEPQTISRELTKLKYGIGQKFSEYGLNSYVIK